jgi:hypothetical protein
VSQAGKEAEGKIATSRNVGWGYDKARVADVILTINPPVDKRGKPLPENQMNGKRSMFVAKARSGASRFMMRLHTDFTRALVKQDEGEPAEEASEGDDG